MKQARSLAVTIACVIPVACNSVHIEYESAEWAGDVITEGNVTTVLNESGSVWAGAVTLIEEASIGVDAGDDPYMLGRITALAASDGKIFVADEQVPALRVYDFAGVHLLDIGAPGQGPGEYQRLSSIDVATDGRVFLRDDRARRIWIYTPAGEYVGAYTMTSGLNSSTPMFLSVDDVPYTVTIAEMLMDDPNRLWQLGMQAHGPDGPVGDPIVEPIDDSFEPATLRNEQGSVMRPVPFHPEEAWAVTRHLDVISGVPTRYRFQIDRPDGSRVVVDKYWEPIPVDPDEAAWHRRLETATMRSVVPEWIWEGHEIPDVKPPYRDFIPTQSGAIWVRRPGPGVRLPNCDENAETSEEFSAAPCWEETTLIDIFDSEGSFLAALPLPPGFRLFPVPYIDGDVVIARVEDELGINRVKRYRLDRQD